ncbi:MAG TPA: magnesium transporter CorA family protein [Candidatus Nitrosocosmicus sp.]
MLGGKNLTVNNRDLYWTDIQEPSPDNLKELEQYYFHRLNLDDCLSKVQIPKIDKYSDHVFLILHFPVYKEDKSEHDIPNSSQLSIFVGKNFLVTIHNDDLKAITEIFQLCKNSNKEREILMGILPAFLLHHIIDVLVDDFLRGIIKLENSLDDQREVILNKRNTSAESKKINLLRIEVTTLRRIAIPLKITVSELTSDIRKFSNKDVTPLYSDLNDHLKKILKTLGEAKETIEIYKDIYFMATSEKSNKILSILTIIFTLTIPVTVIGTFYGMNIGMPGRIEAPPTFLGPYTTMIFVIILSVSPSLLMYWYFRRAGWMSFD